MQVEARGARRSGDRRQSVKGGWEVGSVPREGAQGCARSGGRAEVQGLGLQCWSRTNRVRQSLVAHPTQVAVGEPPEEGDVVWTVCIVSRSLRVVFLEVGFDMCPSRALFWSA